MAHISDTTAEDFLERFGRFGASLAENIATGMTCCEIEAFAAVLADLGNAAAAQSWIDAHAEGDEPEDEHYRGEDE
jgi:hypothetical protein